VGGVPSGGVSSGGVMSGAARGAKRLCWGGVVV
jgi:hypothetical protein